MDLDITSENQWPKGPAFAKSIDNYFEEFRKINPEDWKNEYLNNPKIENEMKEKIEKTEKNKKKQFSVIVDQKEILATSKRTEAISKIAGCQTELIPLIILVDHDEQKSFHYTKTIHQNNYRIQAGNYEKDSVLKPAPEVTTAEE